LTGETDRERERLFLLLSLDLLLDLLRSLSFDFRCGDQEGIPFRAGDSAFSFFFDLIVFSGVGLRFFEDFFDSFFGAGSGEGDFLLGFFSISSSLKSSSSLSSTLSLFFLSLWII
jgi:hypothetical protein